MGMTHNGAINGCDCDDCTARQKDNVMSTDIPGPMLDAWLAVNLMGWRLTSDHKFWLDASGAYGSHARKWTPSTSPDLAFGKIVPAMKKLRWRFTLEQAAGGKWLATFRRSLQPRCVCRFHGTVAGAVCLAAKAESGRNEG